MRHDAIAQTLDLDLQYGLHAPSLETVLHMIPESILQKKEVSVKGEVAFKGELKGTYGKQKLPLATLDIKIKDASARYAGLPYGIDKLEADFFAQIDLMHDSPSYLNLKAFHFKGANTSIQADMKVENLLADPDITFHAESNHRPECAEACFSITRKHQYGRGNGNRFGSTLPYVLYKEAGLGTYHG